MIKLYDTYGEEIDAVVSKALPRKVANKIVNILLNGQVHTQTIGSARTEVDVVCDLGQASKDKIDNCYCNDEPIEVERYGKYYSGLILEDPHFDVIVGGNNPWYNCQFTIAVSEEGDV
jgi:hypothetical protein